jgi:hypothetical protein
VNIASHAMASLFFCFFEMRHKDILLNKFDQIFIEDLLNNY